MTDEPIWMFNENTTRHRGVWHIIEGELKTKVIEERRYERKRHIWRNHTKSCQGIIYQERQKDDTFYPTGRYKVQDCTCKYDTDEWEIIIGEYTEIHIQPEYTRVDGQPVLCNQTRIHGSTLRSDYGDYRKKHEDGATYITEDKIVPLHLWTGELPPGPSCSRCRQAWDKRHDDE